MLQVRLEEPERFVDREIDPPSRDDGEALVRVRRIGVCGTDLHAFAGRQPFFSYPRVLGHELGGEVLEAPADRQDLVGKTCAVEPYLACGHCRACRLGRSNCCESLEVIGVHRDGGMQPLLAVPADRLFPSESLSLDQLALVETLGIGAHAVERGAVGPGESALVVGAGPIGLAVVQFAQAAGADVHVVEPHDVRRAFVSDWGVATHATAPEELFSVVFDATGNQRAMEASVERVAPAGRLVLVGLVLDRISFHDPLFHRREMTILSSRNSWGLFPRIMEMIASGTIDTTPWITHRMALAETAARFSRLRGEPSLVKAMIEVED